MQKLLKNVREELKHLTLDRQDKAELVNTVATKIINGMAMDMAIDDSI